MNFVRKIKNSRRETDFSRIWVSKTNILKAAAGFFRFSRFFLTVACFLSVFFSPAIYSEETGGEILSKSELFSYEIDLKVSENIEEKSKEEDSEEGVSKNIEDGKLILSLTRTAPRVFAFDGAYVTGDLRSLSENYITHIVGGGSLRKSREGVFYAAKHIQTIRIENMSGGVLNMSESGILPDEWLKNQEQELPKNIVSESAGSELRHSNSESDRGLIFEDDIESEKFALRSNLKNSAGAAAQSALSLLAIVEEANSPTSSVINDLVIINDTTGNGTINIQSGGILAGTGTIGGQIHVHAGGVLDPGNRIGTLRVNDDVRIDAGGILHIDLRRDYNDLLFFPSTQKIPVLDLRPGAILHIESDFYAEIGQSFMISAYSAIEGTFGDTVTASNGQVFTIVYDEAIFLVAGPIPEPSTYVTLCVIAATMTIALRYRRRQKKTISPVVIIN